MSYEGGGPHGTARRRGLYPTASLQHQARRVHQGRRSLGVFRGLIGLRVHGQHTMHTSSVETPTLGRLRAQVQGGVAFLHVSQQWQGAVEVDAPGRRRPAWESFLPAEVFSMEGTPPAPPTRLWWRGGLTRGLPPCFA